MADAPLSPVGGGAGSHDSGGEQSPPSVGVREQDRYLPIANISRIMKKALPANGKIAKDAKDTVQECVSEFISFVTSEASDKCQKEKRKTINGDDLLWAMATLGFEDYIEPLKIYLARYRELEGDTKGSVKGGEGSARKDMAGGQPGQSAQYGQQPQLTQNMSYMSPQNGMESKSSTIIHSIPAGMDYNGIFRFHSTNQTTCKIWPAGIGELCECSSVSQSYSLWAMLMLDNQVLMCTRRFCGRNSDWAPGGSDDMHLGRPMSCIISVEVEECLFLRYL